MLHVQYSLPVDEHNIFETCRRQEEFKYNINLKSAFCWITLRNCITMHGTKNMNIKRPSELMRDAEWAVETYRSKGQSLSRLVVGDTKV